MTGRGREQDRHRVVVFVDSVGGQNLSAAAEARAGISSRQLLGAGRRLQMGSTSAMHGQQRRTGAAHARTDLHRLATCREFRKQGQDLC